MKTFVQRQGEHVIGVLNGFDRLRLRGTKRLLASVMGMLAYMTHQSILLKDFGQFALQSTAQIVAATKELLRSSGRPYVYLGSPSIDKEQQARAIAQRDGIGEGLICVLGSVEPCWSFDIHRNRETRKLDLVARYRKGLHYYHYFQHPVFGFMHARLQTWLPYNVHVCLNGREWLARQMDRRGICYLRRENCFVDVQDIPAAQQLLDEQLRTDWPTELNRIAERVNPAEAALFGKFPVPYYWSADQTEWATDILFRSPGELSRLYPTLIRYGMEAFGSRDVLRFLGQKVPASRGVHGNFKGQVTTDLKERPEGMRIKHSLNANSVKMYDKQGSVLRVETTINNVRQLKAYRPKQGDEDGPKSWKRMRKGIADLHRRAELSQASNERYLEALSAAEESRPLKELVRPLCRRVRWKGKTVRAMNPLSSGDANLLAAVSKGEFLLNGMRNRDLRVLLMGEDPKDKAEVRRRSGKVTRLLRLLRAHGLVHKLPHTHRYMLSPKGRAAASALLSAQAADIKKLTAAA